MEALKRVDAMKHRLVAQHDYSILAVFRLIDQYSHGKVTTDNLRIFLSKFDCCADLTESDLKAWIARHDKDVDGGLNFVELIGALQTIAKAPQARP